jgi:hypothetical protein
MSFDADDMVPYKGNMFSKEVLWHKCKGLGWTKALFGRLEDDEIVKVMAQETFLVLPHPEVIDYLRGKTANYDRWLGGMQKLYMKTESKHNP